MNKKFKTIIFILIDCLIVVGSYLLGLAILEKPVIHGWILTKWYLMPGAVVLTLLAHKFFQIYSRLWEYAGFADTVRISCSCLVVCVYNLIIAICFDEISLAWAFLTSFVIVVATGASRLVFRLRHWLENTSKKRTIEGKVERVIIVGAGSAGDILIKEIKRTDQLNMRVVCVLDDDENKVGGVIEGVKIAGKISEVTKFAEKYQADKIIIAMPSADAKTVANVIEKCKKTKCKVLTIPGIYQFANEKVSVTNAKEVSISDLLGREQVNVNLDEIMGYIEGKIVLVTGGGGSIGSELCRQIAMHNPKKLIIVDIYENNAYDIEQELLRKLPNLNLLVLIASVRDSKKMNNIFAKYRPEIVFHAAAHKHVPLMETSPNEAVKNNVSGTYKVATAAGEHGAEKFVLISTDKAVNPTNIMGATKRICEMIIQAMNKKYKTNYVAVRFGNVLGSNGSVIPFFKKQIEAGGPLTVTHKDIVRYFMTIPEAVSLVLQAGAYAKGGEIFVLDMGEPVKIYDLAVNMIKLSGYEPFKDIDIKIIGLRPGEKLYEERLMKEEGLKRTENKKISIGKPLEIDEKNLFNKIEELYVEAYNETDRMKELVHELVPTYTIDKRNI